MKKAQVISYNMGFFLSCLFGYYLSVNSWEKSARYQSYSVQGEVGTSPYPIRHGTLTFLLNFGYIFARFRVPMAF